MFFSVTNSDTLIKIKHDQSWTGSDTIRASQIRDGKWLAEGGFSITNLGNLDRIGAEGALGCSHVAAKRACSPRRGLEGEPRSGSNF